MLKINTESAIGTAAPFMFKQTLFLSYGRRGVFVELLPTPHFVPKGIASCMRDFIILVLILKFFICLFFLKNKVPLSQ